MAAGLKGLVFATNRGRFIEDRVEDTTLRGPRVVRSRASLQAKYDYQSQYSALRYALGVLR